MIGVDARLPLFVLDPQDMQTKDDARRSRRNQRTLTYERLIHLVRFKLTFIFHTFLSGKSGIRSLSKSCALYKRVQIMMMHNVRIGMAHRKWL